MEHVVQLGINIDDGSIARAIENGAKEQIVDKISLVIEEAMGITRKGGDYFRGIRQPISYKADNAVSLVIERICEDCRDQIIEMASSKLAERAVRQKWYRDAMAEKVKIDADE